MKLCEERPVAQQENVKEIELICDGSVFGNPGPGAWVCIIDGQRLSGFEERTTSSRMELTSILEGLRAISAEGSRVRIITDSLYAIKVLTKTWKAKKNRRLIEEIWEEIAKHEVWFRYIPHEENEAHSEALSLLRANLKETDFGPF